MMTQAIEDVTPGELRERALNVARFAAIVRLAGDAMRLAPQVREPGDVRDLSRDVGVAAGHTLDYLGALIVALLDPILAPSEIDELRDRALASPLFSLEASAAITAYLAIRRDVA